MWFHDRGFRFRKEVLEDYGHCVEHHLGFILSQFVKSSPWSRLGYVHYKFHLAT